MKKGVCASAPDSIIQILLETKNIYGMIQIKWEHTRVGVTSHKSFVLPGINIHGEITTMSSSYIYAIHKTRFEHLILSYVSLSLGHSHKSDAHEPLHNRLWQHMASYS